MQSNKTNTEKINKTNTEKLKNIGDKWGIGSRKNDDINIHDRMSRRKAQWKKDRHQRRAEE